ncbi:GAD-like domain-containing protein [Nocardia sp. NPDC059240]|uniref:GAD-like domain-containing protein n=1 Tax=Nocardia sp. NPDC059240 TaxID=3346786 RepID=UPI0036B8C765
MSFPVSDITDHWGQPTSSAAVPAETFDRYADLAPGFLLELWRELGFAGFRKGMLWLCDPVQWQDTVDDWTVGLRLPSGDDSWIAVTRSAFGRMTLWGRRTGLSLTVVPDRGWVFANDQSHEMATDFDRDVQLYASLLATSEDTLDPEADDDKPLFKRVLKKLGPVSHDTMYGFVPAMALGGPTLPNHAEIVDAAVHMQLLSQLNPRAMMADNPYR